MVSQPSSISIHQFRGSIGMMQMDDVKIPLWNFASTTEACQGAVRYDTTHIDTDFSRVSDKRDTEYTSTDPL